MRSAIKSVLLLVIIYLGFISLGLPDGTFGLAWPVMYPQLGLPIGLAGTIMIIGTLLSGLSGFSSGRVVGKLGTGAVVTLSCVLTGSGLMMIGVIPSGLVLYLSAIPLGIGAGAVDAGLNAFVARHYSGRHMNWLHACWGIGATCGPLFMGYAISGPMGWRVGYMALGSVQLTLALLFFLSLRLWRRVPERKVTAGDEQTATVTPTVTANSLAGVLSMLVFVLYVGVETMTGLWIGSILIVGRGFSPEVAAGCTASFYGSITVGRILVGFVVDRLGNRMLISLGIAVAALGGLLFGFAHGPEMSYAGLILLGGGFAPIYPCMMHEVPRRFAPEAVTTVIGRQTGASYIGAASMPAIGGWIAQHSVSVIPWVTVGGILALGACVTLLNRKTPAPR